MNSAADFGTSSEILAVFVAPHFFLVCDTSGSGEWGD